VFDSNLTTLASSVTLTSDYVSTRPRHRPSHPQLSHKPNVRGLRCNGTENRVKEALLDHLDMTAEAN
jgi:hypothetical protein